MIGTLSKDVWEGIALSLAYGLISMAILQSFKDMYWREAFNRSVFFKNFPRNTAAADDAKTLIDLSASGDEGALFALPIDKLAGQVSLAANAVIENPKLYSHLLSLLAKGADPNDLKILEDTDPSLFVRDSLTSGEQIDRGRFTDARTRVSHHIQRNLDKLQLSATQRWTRANQAISLVISFVVGMLPVILVEYGPREFGVFRTVSFLPVSVVLSVLGGFLAPLLRDLLSSASQKS